MKFVVIAALLVTTVSASSAEYMTGFAVDSSSNILMRTGGQSGTMLSVYGAAALKSSKAQVSYDVNGGVIDRYDGIQYHFHTFSASFALLARRTALLEALADYDIVRYGEISILTGYNQFGGGARFKSYLTRSTLLRSEVKAEKRSYRTFVSENFTGTEGFLRLDRFFDSGTTLRGQIDAGYRRYSGEPLLRKTSLLGLRVRAAQALGMNWGIWFEIRSSTSTHEDASSTIRTDTPHNYAPLASSDPGAAASKIDRIFLDDRYKYSSYAFQFQTKYVFGGSGQVRFDTSIAEKKYKGSLTSTYWYLPPAGWDEVELNLMLTLSYRPSFAPGKVHPAIDIYHVNVDATESYLSYESTGVSLRFDLY